MAYLFWGHVITWIMVIFYVVYLKIKTKKLERELEDIQG